MLTMFVFFWFLVGGVFPYLAVLGFSFVGCTFFILFNKMNLYQLHRYVAHAEMEEEWVTSTAGIE